MHCCTLNTSYSTGGKEEARAACQEALHAHAHILGCTHLEMQHIFYSILHSIGGKEEARAAYEEALHAIFTLNLECHRHTQPHKSKKNGHMKWAMIEMWPMMVCAALPSPFAILFICAQSL